MPHLLSPLASLQMVNFFYFTLRRVASLVLVFSLLVGHLTPFLPLIPTTYAADDGNPAVLQSFTSSTSNGSYTTGAAINITANFDEPVDATSTMSVTLDTAIQVTLTGDGDNTMSGTYTVDAGENSADLTITSIDSANITTVDDNPPVNSTSYSIPSGQNLGDNASILVDNSGPSVSEILVGGNYLNIFFNENIDTGSVPSVGDFAIRLFGSPVTIVGMIVQSKRIKLITSSTFSNGDNVEIDFTNTASSLRDVLGNVVNSFSGISAIYSEYTPICGQILTGVEPYSAQNINGKLYISNLSSNFVTVVDTNNNNSVTTIQTTGGSYISAKWGNKLYLPNQISGGVSVINTESNTYLYTIPSGNTSTFFGIKGNKLYVNNFASNSYTVIDMNTDTVLSTISVPGGSPYGPTIIGDKMYVHSLSSNLTPVIDTTTDSLQGSFNGGSSAYGLQLGNNLYIVGSGNLIDTTTNSIINSSGIEGYFGLQVGSKIYVTNHFTNSLGIVNAITGNGIGSLSVGLHPYFSSFLNGKLYVGNQNSNSLSVIDTNSDLVIGEIPVGDFPFYSVVVGEKLYVLNGHSNDITIVDTLNKTFTDGGHCVNDESFVSLSNITSTSPNANYTSGGSINITANFSAALGSGSKMRVTLNTGDVVDLTTVSGSTLSGTYTVGSGDLTADLTVIDISTDSNFTSVADSSGNNVSSSFSVPASPDLSNDTPRNLGDLKNISVGGEVCSIAAGTNPYQMVTVGNLNYVANMGSDNVSVIDTTTNTVVGSPITVGGGPYGVAYNSTTKEIYVANIDSNNVSVIDADPANAGTTFKTVTHTINVGVQPYYVASLGTKIYVTNNLSNSVSVINTATHTVTDTISVGTAPRGIRAHGTDLYVANYGSGSYGSAPTSAGTVSVIDSTNNTVTDTITVGVGPRGVTVLGDEVYVANFEDDTVSVISTATNTVTHTISVGNTPRGITASNGKIYVENYQAGTVSVINPATHAVTATVAVGNTPAGFTTVGTDLYISRFTDNVVSIFDTTTNTLRTTCENDTTAPTLSSHTPTGIAVENLADVTALTMTFSEAITKATGNITIYNASNDTLVATINVTNSSGSAGYVTTSGSVATITLPTSLQFSGVGGYYIHVPNTAFEDVSGNAFAGISNNTDFTFQGVMPDTTPPSAPSAFTVTVIGNSTSADLAWTNPVTDFASVTIRRSTSAFPTSITDGSAVTGGTNITGTSLADSGLTHGTYYYAIFAKDAAGNVSTSATVTATIDTTAPTVSTVTPVNTPTTDTTPDYTFTTDEAGTITYGGSCSSVTTSAILGNNTITLNTLTPATYTNCTITVTDAATNASTALSIPSFTISAPSTGGGGGGGSTTPVTGNQFCIGTLPSGATVLQTGYAYQSSSWRHDTSPTGPYQWCSFRCQTNTQYNSASSSCIPLSVIDPSLFTPLPLFPPTTPIVSTFPSYLLPTPTRPFWKPWKVSLTPNSVEEESVIAAMNNTGFFYPSEDPNFLTQLQKQSPDKNITEEMYINQCVTKDTKPYYRKCSLVFDLDTFSLFRDDVVCESFIVLRANDSDYRFQDTAPRKEAVGVALKMKRENGTSVPFIKSEEYKNIYYDIGRGEASWIQPVVETALKYGIISAERKIFEPDRDVTRAEAYVMIMKSVCMHPKMENGDLNWQKSVFERAQIEGLTMRTWDTFEPDRSILRQELFVLASSASDWAERTGGCDPKPEWCFVK